MLLAPPSASLPPPSPFTGIGVASRAAKDNRAKKHCEISPIRVDNGPGGVPGSSTGVVGVRGALHGDRDRRGGGNNTEFPASVSCP